MGGGHFYGEMGCFYYRKMAFTLPSNLHATHKSLIFSTSPKHAHFPEIPTKTSSASKYGRFHPL